MSLLPDTDKEVSAKRAQSGGSVPALHAVSSGTKAHDTCSQLQRQRTAGRACQAVVVEPHFGEVL